MKKTTLLIIIIVSIFIFSISIMADEKQNPNLQKKGIKINVNVDVKFDSSSCCERGPDFNNIKIDISPLTEFKRFEISPIFASRSGIEFNVVFNGKSSNINFFKDGKPIREMKSKSFSMISLKYFPTKDDIPDYKENKNPVLNYPNASYIDEKTKNSFSLGCKDKDIFEKSNNFYGSSGLVLGLGFVFEDRVHLYKDGAQNIGRNDLDVHFYFEVEPEWENENFTAGINYNTYFHQFGFKLGVKF